MTMNRPRRSKAGKSENERLAESEAVRTQVITASQRTIVSVSISRKNVSTRPFHTSLCKRKLIDPKIMRSMSTISRASEW